MKKKLVSLTLLLVTISICSAQYSPPSSVEAEVSVDTGNGYGSTGIYARRFANTDATVGSDITYTQSATNGDSFTINKTGVYAISYTDISAGGDAVAISLNSSGTTTINSVLASNRLCSMALQAGVLNSCSVVLLLNSGDVIRATAGGGNVSDSNAFVRLIITKLKG